VIDPTIRFAFVTIVAGQEVMVVLMTMSPLHMKEHGATLTLVGVSISMHVLGMYGFLAAGGRAGRPGRANPGHCGRAGPLPGRRGRWARVRVGAGPVLVMGRR
jgi:hypothetical protein